MIDDRSGLVETRLTQGRILGTGAIEKIKENKMQRTQTLWTQEVDLAIGEYQVIEASRPTWKINFYITPK